jgi:hypothetical protein
MTFYLPNDDLGPVAGESAEFIDLPDMKPDRSRPSVASRNGLVRDHERRTTAVPLDTQTRLNITRWAAEYISHLVRNRCGNGEDVRAVIRDLHDNDMYTDDEVRWS